MKTLKEVIQSIVNEADLQTRLQQEIIKLGVAYFLKTTSEAVEDYSKGRIQNQGQKPTSPEELKALKEVEEALIKASALLEPFEL